jgi:hypothetical protein
LLRLLTAIGIMIATGVAILQGLGILQFVTDGAPTWLAVGDPQPWIVAPGVRAAVLDAELRKTAAATGFGGVDQRIDLLTRSLEVQPLSSGKWLSLAGMRLLTPKPADLVAALTMSAITGPNEGAVMWRRGIFGLLEWENLPADARKRTVADLSGAIITGTVGDGELNQAKQAAATQPPMMRSQIKSLLRGQGVTPTALIAMGL